ncbi:MAG: hypothetical protein QOG69_2848 [Actinomycetota bacterium]|jgi:hypothetical protein|nr:hypothetical protein [Actinomycetota bacterium]
MKQYRGRAILGSAILAGILGLAGFAFTASNTVPASKAGDGTGAVTGYVVSSVHYGLNATDPTKADTVTFDLDSTPIAGSTIKTKVGGNWYTCTNVVAAISCPTTSPQATVAPITTLQVVVAD